MQKFDLILFLRDSPNDICIARMTFHNCVENTMQSCNCYSPTMIPRNLDFGTLLISVPFDNLKTDQANPEGKESFSLHRFPLTLIFEHLPTAGPKIPLKSYFLANKTIDRQYLTNFLTFQQDSLSLILQNK